MFQLFSNIFASVVSFSGWGASQGAKQAAIYVTDKFGGSGRLSSDGRSRLKNPTLINNMSLKNSCAECHESRDAKSYPDPRGSYRENLQANYQRARLGGHGHSEVPKKDRPSEDLERGGSRPSVLPNNLGSPSSQTKGALTNITAPNVRRFIKF